MKFLRSFLFASLLLWIFFGSFGFAGTFNNACDTDDVNMTISDTTFQSTADTLTVSFAGTSTSWSLVDCLGSGSMTSLDFYIDYDGTTVLWFSTGSQHLSGLSMSDTFANIFGPVAGETVIDDMVVYARNGSGDDVVLATPSPAMILDTRPLVLSLLTGGAYPTSGTVDLSLSGVDRNLLNVDFFDGMSTVSLGWGSWNFLQTITQNGTYTFIVTDSVGRMDSQTITVDWIDNSFALSGQIMTTTHPSWLYVGTLDTRDLTFLLGQSIFGNDEEVSGSVTVSYSGSTSTTLLSGETNSFVVSGSMITWSIEDYLTYSYDFFDLYGNAASGINAPLFVDTIAPDVTLTNMVSDNPLTCDRNPSNTQISRSGDVVTLSFSSHEQLTGVDIVFNQWVVTWGMLSFTETPVGPATLPQAHDYEITYLVQDAPLSEAWPIDFTLTYQDLAGNIWVTKTRTDLNPGDDVLYIARPNNPSMPSNLYVQGVTVINDITGHRWTDVTWTQSGHAVYALPLGTYTTANGINALNHRQTDISAWTTDLYIDPIVFSDDGWYGIYFVDQACNIAQAPEVLKVDLIAPTINPISATNLSNPTYDQFVKTWDVVRFMFSVDEEVTVDDIELFWQVIDPSTLVETIPEREFYVDITITEALINYVSPTSYLTDMPYYVFVADLAKKTRAVNGNLLNIDLIPPTITVTSILENNPFSDIYIKPWDAVSVLFSADEILGAGTGALYPLWGAATTSGFVDLGSLNYAYVYTFQSTDAPSMNDIMYTLSYEDRARNNGTTSPLISWTNLVFDKTPPQVIGDVLVNMTPTAWFPTDYVVDGDTVWLTFSLSELPYTGSYVTGISVAISGAATVNLTGSGVWPYSATWIVSGLTDTTVWYTITVYDRAGNQTVYSNADLFYEYGSIVISNTWHTVSTDGIGGTIDRDYNMFGTGELIINGVTYPTWVGTGGSSPFTNLTGSLTFPYTINAYSLWGTTDTVTGVFVLPQIAIVASWVATTSTTASLTFDTNKIATGTLSRGPTTSFGTDVNDLTLWTDSSFALSSLVANTTYYYSVTYYGLGWPTDIVTQTGSFMTAPTSSGWGWSSSWGWWGGGWGGSSGGSQDDGLIPPVRYTSGSIEEDISDYLTRFDAINQSCLGQYPWYAERNFVDIADSIYKESVETLLSYCAVKGINEREFGLNKAIKNSEALKIIANTLRLSLWMDALQDYAWVGETSFEDIDGDQRYGGYARYLESVGALDDRWSDRIGAGETAQMAQIVRVIQRAAAVSGRPINVTFEDTGSMERGQFSYFLTELFNITGDQYFVSNNSRTYLILKAIQLRVQKLPTEQQYDEIVRIQKIFRLASDEIFEKYGINKQAILRVIDDIVRDAR